MPWWGTTKQRKRYDPSYDTPKEKKEQAQAATSPQAAQAYAERSTVREVPSSGPVLSSDGEFASTDPRAIAAHDLQVKRKERVLQSLLNTPLPGLDMGQTDILTTVLNEGIEAGADPEELLAAIETGLVESDLRNLGYGDADSEGWRQERKMYYPNPRNVEASAERFFDELKTDAGAQDAPTPGLMAQAAQGSAFPERYDEREAEARDLLSAFMDRQQKVGGKTIPEPNDPLSFEGGPEDVVTAGDVVPRHKLFKWLEGAGGNTANRENIENLNPVFARHLIRAAAKSGDPLTITSAQRSEEEQGEISPGTNPAAPPGYSVHQFGGAVDSEPTPEQIELLDQEGIEHGYAGGEPDPPHTEFTDPRLIKRMTNFGPVRSGYAPSGLEEAVGDITDWSGDGVSSGGAVAPTSSLASYAGDSSSSVSGSLLDAAMERAEPESGPTPATSRLASMMNLLEAPLPSVREPLQPLRRRPDDLLKLALGGRA